MNLTYTMIALIIPLIGNQESRKKLFFQVSCVQLLLLIVMVIVVVYL